MALEHGIYTREIDTAGFSMVSVDTAIPFIVGTAPINMKDTKNVNNVVFCNNLAEFTEAFGSSNNLMDYTLVQAAKVYFTLYGVGPVFMVNVLDPKKHASAVITEEVAVTDKKAVIETEGILQDTLKITNKASSVELVKGTDYYVSYDEDGYVEIYLVNEADIKVEYKKLDPSKVTKEDIIGGVDPVTYDRKGLELIHEAFVKYRKTVGVVMAPGYSHLSDIIAVMETKTKNISGAFQAHAIIDCPADKKYKEIPEWKNSLNIVDEDIIGTYGLVRLGDEYYYQSLHLGALMASVDNKAGGVPSESPSNKNYKMDGLFIKTADGFEKINLDLTQANYLNENGIVTALNFVNGWTSWGNYNTCYPSRTDIKDSYVPVKRMFKWAANTLILSTWQFIDRKFTNVLRDSINMTVEDWLKTLTGNHLYDAKIELREESNSLSDMQKGKFTWHIDFSPILPFQAGVYELEYNLNDITNYYFK